MDDKNYDSSEFYSYKFKNFSTMTIAPMAIVVILLLIGSFFAVKQNVVKSMGIVEPKQVLNVPISKYHEGQIIKKNKQVKLLDNQKQKLKSDRIVHRDENKKVAYLMPRITNHKKLQLVSYLPGSQITAIAKGQTVYFQVPNAQGNTLRLKGKVTRVDTYPVTIHKQSVYQVLATVKATSVDKLRYGMQGDLTIITGKTTYFNYIKDKVLNQ
ncbi:HlyD family efflux transporter periplasmic adaptor subunit [Lactobacillus sp. HT06-2]|uniref:HlyD family efflux transporter periplasmic adaptor subunit n=1 Tax=Lactobacillus sp. HT06-2 TaxID=2080222 RepID=UPI000CD85B52|nr:HlyD family efflux transporter periplasmic adaptor subunit [Lactobacillus sp. HT06-2]